MINGVDLYARDSAGQTPFLHACRGNTREVLAFLARRGARIHDIDNDDKYCVHHAARRNSREILELLFQELQTDIHIKDWKNRFPIHHAAIKGNNQGGMTPVHYAAQNGYANIVRLLEQHGADIDAVTDCRRSVFMLDAENGHKDVLLYCINESSLSTRKEKRFQSLSQSRELV